MKKYIFMAVAAIAVLSSCSKEDDNNASFNDSGAFYATIEDGSTRTTLGTGDNANKVLWSESDKININGTAYTLSEGEGTTKAKFTGESVSGTPYNAYYPASLYDGTTATLPATQTYQEGKISNLPMYAQSDDQNLTFKNLCGVIALTLKGTKSVKSITVTSTANLCGAFTVTDNAAVISSGTKTVTLDCGSGVTLNETTGVTFYIAIPDGSHQLTFRVNTTDDYYYTQTTTSAVNVERNKIYPIEWTPTFCLNGKFSVSATKQVNFTKGNLYWDGSDFRFETSQTAYPTEWNTSHVGHFFWTKTAEASYNSSYSDGTTSTSDNFFADGSDASHMLTVEGQSDLYVLSKDEWEYLIKTRTNASSLRKINVKVNGVEGCLVIAPDDYTGTIASSYDASEWATAEATGFVCLPRAGHRTNGGTSITYANSSGRYLSATLKSQSTAYNLYFSTSDIKLDYEERNSGRTIRLVCTASN